jgi:serine/threonine protein kinase
MEEIDENDISHFYSDSEGELCQETKKLPEKSESDTSESDKLESDMLLDKMVLFLEPFAADESKQIENISSIMLAAYLDSYFSGQGPFTIIGVFQRGNSTANLVTTGSNLLVQKTFLLKADWLLPFNVLNEIHTMITIHQKLRGNPYFSKVFHININQLSARITTEFIPLSFEEVFTKNLPQSFIKKRVFELLTAISLLHIKLHLAHRDIKPENIRLQADGTLVLLDYDTCCGRESETWWTRPVCSQHTRAPELYVPFGVFPYEMERYNAYLTDIFSAGCVVLSMCLECKLPFANEPQVKRDKQIKEFSKLIDEKNQIITKIGKDGYDLISRMLAFDPLKRPDIKVCLGHSFFQG